MSILPQHSQNFGPLPHAPRRCNSCRFPLSLRIYSSTTALTKPPTQPRPLVIEPLPLSAEAVPRLTTTNIAPTFTSTKPLLNDPGLKSTWAHRAWVACGCTTVLISLAKSVAGTTVSHAWLEPILAGYIGYVLADLGSGVYHWGIDNYGSAQTPVFGTQIEAFQGHHKWPWTITRREFANNLHALARVVTFSVLPLDFLCDDPILNGFVGVCSGCIMFSQQFHAWSHSTKSKLPPLVVALQDAGILISRLQHAAHHQPPYNNNYCIVSGVWNAFLDEMKVFEALELILFFKLGVRPRSWSEPDSEWTEEMESPSLVTQQGA